MRKNFQKVVDFAIEEKAQIVLHAGDFFDMPDPRYAELLFAIEQLKRLKSAGIKFFLIGGTHDIPKARLGMGETSCLSLLEALDLAELFKEFYKPSLKIMELDDKRIAISGLSGDPRCREGNPFERVEFRRPSADLSLFLFHYAIEGKTPYQYEGPVVPIDTLRRIPFDVIVAGHLHPHSDFPLDNKQVLIPGATERLDFGEEDNECGFYVLEWEDGKTRLKYHPIEVQPMKTLTIHMEELPPNAPNTWLNYILSRVEEVSHHSLMLRCRLVGHIKEAFLKYIPLTPIREKGEALNFYFDLDTSQLLLEAGQRIGGGMISQEKELQAAAEMLKKENAEGEKDLIEEALDLALALWRGEEIED